MLRRSADLPLYNSALQVKGAPILKANVDIMIMLAPSEDVYSMGLTLYFVIYKIK